MCVVLNKYIGCQYMNNMLSILICDTSKVEDIQYLVHIHGVDVSLKTKSMHQIN